MPRGRDKTRGSDGVSEGRRNPRVHGLCALGWLSGELRQATSPVTHQARHVSVAGEDAG